MSKGNNNQTTLPADGSGTDCNIKVMSAEEFANLAQNIEANMGDVNLLEQLEATSELPDRIDVKWVPNHSLVPHIAAFKVKYNEYNGAADSLSSQAAEPSNSPFDQNPAFAEQMYISEFLPSTSRYYSIDRLSPNTRYTVCVSAYPSSIDYWAKFEASMKRCVIVETRPPPDVIAWLVLGMLGLLLVMILLLAAIVVHRRRIQARQNRNLRLASSPVDYETPVVLVASGPQSSSLKQKTFTRLEHTSGSDVLIGHHQPPAYSPGNRKVTGSGHLFTAGGSENRGNGTHVRILAPIANYDDEDGDLIKSGGSLETDDNETCRQPVFLAAVPPQTPTRTPRPNNRPPLAHFTSKSCASQHQTPLMEHRHMRMGSPSTPNVMLFPPHDDASTDLFSADPAAQTRAQQYAHLLLHPRQRLGSQPVMMPHSRRMAVLDNTSTSTSGFFGEESSSSGQSGSSVSGYQKISASAELAHVNELAFHFNPQLQLMPGEVQSEESVAMPNNSNNQYQSGTLKRNHRQVTATASAPPPLPPPYHGLPTYKPQSRHSQDEIDVDTAQDDSDGLICVI